MFVDFLLLDSFSSLNHGNPTFWWGFNKWVEKRKGQYILASKCKSYSKSNSSVPQKGIITFMRCLATVLLNKSQEAVTFVSMKIIITEHHYNAVEIMNIIIHASVKLPFQGSWKIQAQDKKRTWKSWKRISAHNKKVTLRQSGIILFNFLYITIHFWEVQLGWELMNIET
jgi:hypothetical protein